MMFQLTEWTQATLTSVNCRAEVHGSDFVPQLDLRFETVLPNSALEMLAPSLKPALFQAPAQLALAEVSDGNDAPALRFPELGALHWNADEVRDFELEIEGVTDDEGVVLFDVIVGKIGFEPMEGGSVGVTFRCRTTGHQSADTLGRLAFLVQRKLSVRLTRRAIEEEEPAAA
jgi:hypothetical protein